MAPTIIHPHVIIAEYMSKVVQVDRSCLKRDINHICHYLSEKDIISPVNFTYYGLTLYSETFDHELQFLISCDILTTNTNPLTYCLLKGTDELTQIMKLWGISDQHLKYINDAIDLITQNQQHADT